MLKIKKVKNLLVGGNSGYLVRHIMMGGDAGQLEGKGMMRRGRELRLVVLLLALLYAQNIAVLACL